MTATEPGRSAGSLWWPRAAAAVTTVLLLGPAFGPGYLLVRDMVFVPSPPLTGRLLGLWSETPRAVPSDLVVALASHVLPGSIVQVVILVAVLLAAGLGAARLAGRGLAGAVAAVAAIWNPFVAERLAMGQWTLLVGYAAVPWVVLGLSTRAASGRRWRRLATALVLGALGGAAAMVLVGIAVLGCLLVAVVAPERRHRLPRLAGPVALYVALCLPWVVPSVLRPDTGSDPAGFAVFAPSADTAFGVVVSVLTGGGVWNAEVVPTGRAGAAASLGGLVLVGLAAAGLALTGASARRPVTAEEAPTSTWLPSLAASAAIGLVLVLVSALPSAAHLAGLPGGGLLRDGSREVGPWVMLVATGLGLLAGRLRARAVAAVPYAVLLLPFAILPIAGWGVGGRLAPTSYPDDVLSVARLVNSAPEEGGAVVLPYAANRTYAWNDARVSLTPWSRLLRVRVATSSDLVVRRETELVTVRGEDAWADRVGQALGRPDPSGALAAEGVRWVIVDDSSAQPPAGARLVRRGPDVALYRLSGSVRASASRVADPPRPPVLLGDLLAAAAVAVALRPRSLRTTRDER